MAWDSTRSAASAQRLERGKHKPIYRADSCGGTKMVAIECIGRTLVAVLGRARHVTSLEVAASNDMLPASIITTTTFAE